MKHDHEQFTPSESGAGRDQQQRSNPTGLKDYWKGNYAYSCQLYVPAGVKSWWVP
jgi:hypothetical protein